MEQGKSKMGVVILAIIITALVVGGGVYLWQQKDRVNQTQQQEAIQPTTQVSCKIVETYDYEYDIDTGNLKSKKDNKVVYTFSDARFGDQLVIDIFGLDGNKLILWKTGLENSPGPEWTYEIWLTKELEYLDLDNPSQGPKPYVVPEWKKQEAKKLLEQYQYFLNIIHKK